MLQPPLFIITLLGFATTSTSALNLLEVAQASGLNTLIAAATATGQSDVFTQPGQLTVFAPTDAAFAALPIGALEFLLKPDNLARLGQVLGYHVLVGNTLSTDLMDGMTLTSLTQQPLTISATETGFAVNGANIGPADLIADNGVIHIIDQVLIPFGIEFPPDIIDTAVASGQFPTLVAAVQAAGLVDALKSDIFTVFAPSENAFAALPAGAVQFLLRNPALLTDVLLYHVLSGAVMAGDITDGMMAETLLMSNLTFAVSAEGTVTINDSSTVVFPNIEALNGVIHVINNVLVPPTLSLPPHIPGVLMSPDAGSVSTILAALEATGLDEALSAEGPFTLFAPVDSAFASLPPGTVGYLLNEPNMTTLKEILMYHVVAGEIIDSAAIEGGLTSAMSLQGDSLTFSPAGGASTVVSVNGVDVVTSDLTALNGVVMTIDSVLVPSTVTLLEGIADVAIAAGIFTTLLFGLQSVQLGSALNVEDQITVFAPTDTAFASQNVTELLADPGGFIGTLLYHVVAGRFTTADLMDGMVLTSFSQLPLYVSVSPDGVIMINDAEITHPDFLGSNGVAHGISALLTPGYVPTTASPVDATMTPAPVDSQPTPAPVDAPTPAPVDAPTPAPADNPMTPAPVAQSSTPAPVEMTPGETEMPTAGEDGSGSANNMLSVAAGMFILATTGAVALL